MYRREVQRLLSRQAVRKGESERERERKKERLRSKQLLLTYLCEVSLSTTGDHVWISVSILSKAGQV